MAVNNNNNNMPIIAPSIKILEQPASKALRFRYECEGRSAGSIPGVYSTPENKTYPTIQIVGYKGRAVIVVSCVTKDAPYKPHPHNLVGKEGCKKGICTLEINNESMIATFSNLGIQCVKKKDIEEALRIREEIRVDPFRTGFPHRTQTSSIDLNVVRLCFQAFLPGSEEGKYNVLTPVVSDPIYDKKAMSDLVICKLSDSSAPVAGGKEMILLCEKVAKEDIQVRFFEENDNQLVWEEYGDFTPAQVHKQVAIAFRTPRYRSIQVDVAVHVMIQLKRPSDGATSEPLPFQLTPLDSDPGYMKRKRQKFQNPSELLVHLQTSNTQNQNAQVGQYRQMACSPPTYPHVYSPSVVKTEPSVSPSPMHNMQYNVTQRPVSSVPMPIQNNNNSMFSDSSPMHYQSYATTTGGCLYPSTSASSSLATYLLQASNEREMLPETRKDGMIEEPSTFGSINLSFLQNLNNGGNGIVDMSTLLDSSDLSLSKLDSKELAMLDAGNLSENLSHYLNISEDRINNATAGTMRNNNNNTTENMTDSLTRLTNQTYDDMLQRNAAAASSHVTIQK